MNRVFIKYAVFFFAPILLVFMGLEFSVRKMETSFAKNEQRIQEYQEEIEVLILGSSHMASGINAGLLKQHSINLASGNQHHDTDYKILQTMVQRLPQLKTVVLEASYGHFEFPHNTKDFWKNSFYHSYYDVNCFERPTYFKDKLLFLSNPPLLSERLYQYYISKDEPTRFSEFGFNTNNYFGRFKTLNYDEKKIATTNFRINNQPNLAVFRNNAALFIDMLDFLKKKKIQVVICTPPMYKTYLPARMPQILQRRDSLLQNVLERFENSTLVLTEEDTIHYGVRDYWNQSHLNPDGATKFTEVLQSVLNKND